MYRRRTTRAGDWFVLALVGSFYAAAGSAQIDPRDAVRGDAVQEEVDVRVVTLDVLVLGRNSQPVKGLQATDLDLKVNGKEVEIDFLDGFAGPEMPPAESAVDLASQAKPELRDDPPPADDLLSVLMVDRRRTPPGGIARAMRQIRSWLRRAPEGRWIVAEVDREFSLEEVTAEEAAARVQTLRKAKDAAAVTSSLAEERLRKTIDVFGLCAAESVNAVEVFTDRQVGDGLLALQRIGSSVDLLSTLPGRKDLLYVGRGINMRPGDAYRQAIARQCNRPDLGLLRPAQSLAGELESLTVRANAGRVTVHTLEANALRTATAADVAVAPLASGSRSQPEGKLDGFGSLLDQTPRGGAQLGTRDSTFDSLQRVNHQEMLLRLAGLTGGIASTNDNDLRRGLDQISSANRDGYELGFTLDPSIDSGKLDIRLKFRGYRPGYRLFYQRHVVLPTTEDPVEARLKALLAGAETQGGWLSARELTRTALDSGEVSVKILLEFPSSVVTTEADLQDPDTTPDSPPKDSPPKDNVELQLMSMGNDGDFSDLGRTAISISNKQTLQEKVRWEIPLILRQGGHRIALVLRDLPSGETAEVVLDLDL